MKHHGWTGQITSGPKIRIYVAESNYKAAAETPPKKKTNREQRPWKYRKRRRPETQQSGSMAPLIQMFNSIMKLPTTATKATGCPYSVHMPS